MQANPQTEDGYTRFANELLEALIKYRIPGEQMQCLLYISRMTYGYRRKTWALTLDSFVEATGINKPAVSRALKTLLSKKIIIIKKDNNSSTVYGINKFFKEWEPLSKKIIIIKKDNEKTPENPEKSLSKKITTVIKKDNLGGSIPIIVKENLKKEEPSCRNSDEYRLSELLFVLILKNCPKAKTPNFKTWAKHIDLAIRIDKRTPDELEQVIRWCQQHSFWQSNILSTEKLRKQFDQLWIKMNNEKNNTGEDKYDF